MSQKNIREPKAVKRALYFCRYSCDFDAGSTLMPGFAAQNKIDLIIAAASNIGMRFHIMASPSFAAKEKWNRHKIIRDKKNKVIVIIPWHIGIKNHPRITYSVNVLFASFYSLFFVMRRKYEKLISYNCVPDTLMPFLSAKMYSRKSTSIIELEEEVSSDIEAPFLFRIFDYLARVIVPFDGALLSSEGLRNSIKSKNIEILNGVIADKNILNPKREKQDCKKNDKIEILFMGRIDEMRGITIFLEAATRLSKILDRIHFRIIGYTPDSGSARQIATIEKYLKDEKLPIEIQLNVGRHLVDLALWDSDICVSLVKDKKFLTKSFPSKMIEFLAYNKIVVSQYICELRHINNIIWIEDAHVDDVVKAIKQAITLSSELDKSRRNGRSWALENCSQNAVSNKLQKLLCDV